MKYDAVVLDMQKGEHKEEGYLTKVRLPAICTETLLSVLRLWKLIRKKLLQKLWGTICSIVLCVCFAGVFTMTWNTGEPLWHNTRF